MEYSAPLTLIGEMAPSSSSSLSSFGLRFTSWIRDNVMCRQVGTIWQGRDASSSSSGGTTTAITTNPNLHSISVPNAQPVRIAFRNLSPVPLLLCWVSQNGDLHHFYELRPAATIESTNAGIVPPIAGETTTTTTATTTTTTTSVTENTPVSDVFDHLEYSSEGHAFCLVYVDSEDEMESIRQSKSLQGHPRAIVIGGYRPNARANKKEPDNEEEENHTCHLVTITHDLTQCSTSSSTSSCFWPCWTPPGTNMLRKRKRDRRSNLIQGEDEDDDEEDDLNTGGASQPPHMLSTNGWRLRARSVKLDMTPLDTTGKVYEEVTLGGWPCCVEPNWHDGDKDLERIMAKDIEEASKRLPPHARDYLSKHCKIWINRTMMWGPRAFPVRGTSCCYHPDRNWLIDNGLNVDKALCVEINHAANYKGDRGLWEPGGVILHELSHAYHHRVLPDGYDNRDIMDCYDMAMKEGLYESVSVHGSQGPKARAYACDNCMEYWAELSTAYLGSKDRKVEYNKWYPFNRKQLEDHDRRGYALLSRLWSADAVSKHIL